MPRTTTTKSKRGKATSTTSRGKKKTVDPHCEPSNPSNPAPSTSTPLPDNGNHPTPLSAAVSNATISAPLSGNLFGPGFPQLSQTANESNSGSRFSGPSAATPYALPYLHNHLWNTHLGWSQYPPLQYPLSQAPGGLSFNVTQTNPTLNSLPYSGMGNSGITSQAGPPGLRNDLTTVTTPITSSPQRSRPGSPDPPGPRNNLTTVTTPITRSPQRSHSGSPDNTASDEEDPVSKSGSGKRLRISRHNPQFGLVEGAMKGNKEYVIARAKKLREMQTDRATANRRFKKQVEDLISRAERLSIETDCWFILCGQLPGSGPISHYTSPRLRREALEEASTMVSTFQQATYTLNLAKRKDAKEITDNYEKQLMNERTLKIEAESRALAAEKNKGIAEAEIEKSRQREELLQADLDTQRAIVEGYRAQLAAKIGQRSS